MRRGFTIEGVHDRLGGERHLVYGAVAEVHDFFGVSQGPTRVNRGGLVPGIGRRRRVAPLQPVAERDVVDGPGNPPLPCPCTRWFQPDMGSHISILICESEVGFAMADTRQNAGRSL